MASCLSEYLWTEEENDGNKRKRRGDRCTKIVNKKAKESGLECVWNGVDRTAHALKCHYRIKMFPSSWARSEFWSSRSSANEGDTVLGLASSRLIRGYPAGTNWYLAGTNWYPTGTQLVPQLVSHLLFEFLAFISGRVLEDS